LYQDTPLFIF